MPVDQELSALATVASLLPTDIIYLVRDPGGVAEADHKAAVSVLDARYPGAVISVFGRTGAVVAASGDYSAGQISGLGTLAVLNSPLPIVNGGSGQITQQAAIDALSNVVAATDEHVLTKDTASGNVIFKAAAGGGSSLPVADTQTIVMGSADNTKLLRFEVDGFTAGATRVMTLPDQNTTLAGLSVAQTFTESQIIRGALNINRSSGFGNAGSYSALIIGDLTGGGSGNGGLFSIARRSAVNKPFVGFTGWDENADSNRYLYFGGGGWGVPDANIILFYTDPSTAEANDSGLLRLTIVPAGDVGIGGITTPAAELDVKQPSTTGAQPVLRLEQLDVDQPLAQFETTIGTGNAIEAVGAKTLTVTHFVMVKLPGGLTRYIPAGTIA